jgi:putative hemolysin
LGTDLQSDTSETIGGFIIDILGEIPGDGYVMQSIEYGKYSFTILSVKERRIEKVKMHIEPEYEESSGNGEDRGKEDHRS